MLVVLLLGPGVLLQPLLGSGKRAVELPLYAAAAWVVAFWWLRLLPLEWTAPVIALGAASLVGGLFFWRRPPDPGSALVWIAGVALLTVLARSALVAPSLTPAATRRASARCGPSMCFAPIRSGSRRRPR